MIWIGLWMYSGEFKFRHGIEPFHLYLKCDCLRLIFERRKTVKNFRQRFFGFVQGRYDYWSKIHPVCFQFSEAYSFPRPKLLSFYFYSLCLNWDLHSLLLSFNNLRVTWRAFVWETFQAKPRQQFRESFLFVDKNILKQPRELLVFHIIIFNVSLDMYEMPFSSCGRITFLFCFYILQRGCC